MYDQYFDNRYSDNRRLIDDTIDVLIIDIIIDILIIEYIIDFLTIGD